MDDQLLLERLKRGDPAAQSVFVDRFFDDVFRFLRHLTRHVQEAEDLTQQTLIRACRHIDRYNGAASLRTWLHRIAFREFLNWRRGRRIWLQLDPRIASKTTDYATVDESEALLMMLEQLGPKLSAAFLLIEVQQLTHQEAGEVLGIPAGTVKSRLHEAKKRLQLDYNNQLGEFHYVAEAYEH